jgi:hypothetical protein
VIKIGSYAFYFCEDLTSISISGSVTTIDVWAFMNCTGLEEVFFEGSAPFFGTDVFLRVKAKVYYPANDPT